MDTETQDQFSKPEWASHHAQGDYTAPNASLPTRNGLVTGNAVLVGLSPRQWAGKPTIYRVATDAGNVLDLTHNELEELFHPPRWVMITLLPAHVTALQNNPQ